MKPVFLSSVSIRLSHWLRFHLTACFLPIKQSTLKMAVKENKTSNELLQISAIFFYLLFIMHCMSNMDWEKYLCES